MAALAAHPLRLLVLTSSGQLNVWEHLHVLVARWDAIEGHAATTAMDLWRNEETHPRNPIPAIDLG